MYNINPTSCQLITLSLISLYNVYDMSECHECVFCVGIMFGSVVVGLGIAGCVRLRDLLAPLPASAADKLTITGFVSRSVHQPNIHQFLYKPIYVFDRQHAWHVTYI